LQFAQANAQAKNCKRASAFPDRKIIFLIPSLQKFLKPQTHNRHDNDSKTHGKQRLETRTKERQPTTSVAVAQLGFWKANFSYLQYHI
jgi:guanylate kinase